MTDFLADVRTAVDDRTPLALEEHLKPLAHLGAPLDEFVDPVRGLVRGGKRLRAQLCAAGWLAAGGTADPSHPAVLHAGTALELFQAAALVHDDVMDGAHTRRGLPAAHRALAARHTAAGRLGDADLFGVSGAILLGDLLLAASSAELELARAALPEGPARRGREVYDLMCLEVAVGQFLDVRAQDLPWRPAADAVGGALRAEGAEGAEGTTEPSALDSALLVVRHKSARYSVEHPLALGAALGGADRELEGRLRAVGLPLGEAFQLRDDELGVFGSPEVTGKPACDDLREGKRTALLAITLDRLDRAGDAGDRVRALVGRPDLGVAEVDEVRALMRDSGALDAHEDLVAQRREAGMSALAALDAARLPRGARGALTELAGLLTTRTS